MDEVGRTAPGQARPLDLGRVLVVGPLAGRTAEVSAWLGADGFDIVGCEVADARPSFLEHAPDLVVTTLVPGASSALPVALYRWIRARSEVPLVVVVSGRDGEVDPVAVLEGGADILVGERVGRRELVARARALLRRVPPARREAGAVLTRGGLSLDRRAQVVHVGAATVPLEPQEFELLEVLMRNGEKVTRRAALRKLLGAGDTALDGSVRRLRERIEAIEGWRRIVTERGVGLRFLDAPPTRSSAGAGSGAH